MERHGTGLLRQMIQGPASSFELKMLDPRSQEDPGCEAFDWWGPEGASKSALFYRLTDGYLVRIAGHADFHVDLEHSAVGCHAVPGAFGKDCQTLFRNTIRPLIANFLGGLNIHASANVAFDKAWAFVGISGRGKTTLATALAKMGYPYLTDDALPLESRSSGYWAMPGDPEIRLCSDSLSALDLEENPTLLRRAGVKSAVQANPATPYQAAPARLGAIFFLGAGAAGKLSIEKVEPAVALIRLIEHSLILDVEDRERLQSHFERLTQLATAIPCFYLDYPRQFADLPLVIEELTEHLRSIGASDEA